MKRGTPPLVVVTLAFLAGTVWFGVLYGQKAIVHWRFSYSNERSLAEILVYSFVSTVLPLLAILDIVRGKLSGRYLGLLSLMLTWGFTLRAVTDSLAFGFHRDALILLHPFTGVLLGLAALVAGFGFSNEVGRYFGEG